MGFLDSVSDGSVGTFSTVYKAEDLQYDQYFNDWDMQSPDATVWVSPPLHKRTQKRRKPHYVAIKKIYVTSSPIRIQNELELLNDLKWCKDVCPLITAFRHQDQVVAVLPYYRHQDFRVNTLISLVHLFCYLIFNSHSFQTCSQNKCKCTSGPSLAL